MLTASSEPGVSGRYASHPYGLARDWKVAGEHGRSTSRTRPRKGCDAYSGELEETIVTEVVANALDSSTSHIRLLT